MTNAIPIPSTTIPPATKLEIKFANEGVIYKSPFLNNKLKIVRLTTLSIVSTFKRKA